jgi:hypothetical protein
MSLDGFAGLLAQLRKDFPDVNDHVIVRQLDDAADSVALFGVDHAEAPALVERLVRSHLEALREIRQP